MVIRDGCNRTIDYVRISVTDRCNLRCAYCMPQEGVSSIPHNEILTYEEILRVISIFKRYGVEKFRLTGGEPLVRKGIFYLLEKLSGTNFFLTSNLTCSEEYCIRLNTLQLAGINFSLDTLNPIRYKQLTGKDILSRVLTNVDILSVSQIKMNTVIIKDFNADEINALIDFAVAHGVTIRFIEKMNWTSADLRYVSNREIIRKLVADGRIAETGESDRNSTAVYYKLIHEKGKVGFISPHSAPFCYRCNRVRLTSDGMLKTCLFDSRQHTIKHLLRSGAADDDIITFIRKAVELKHPAPRVTEGEYMNRLGG